MQAEAGIPGAAADTPAQDSTYWDSTDNKGDMVVEEAGADSVRDDVRDPVPGGQTHPADTSDE